MKSTKRALRRHHKDRMKDKAKSVLKFWFKEPTESEVGKHADNLAVCSCEQCGNPRRTSYKSLTRQEMVAPKPSDEF